MTAQEGSNSNLDRPPKNRYKIQTMQNINDKTQQQRKAEKRAEALRANLRRRKELALTKQSDPTKGQKHDE